VLSRSRAFGYENLGFCVIQRRPRAKFFKRRDTRCEEFTDALRMGGAAIIPHLRSQAELFSRSHRVVSVDLRGHGRSDAPHQNYTMAPSRLEVMGQLQTYDRTDLFLAQLLETAARPAGLFG
jgi:pimeloyl-ACP methyl ester carboxylesterase